MERVFGAERRVRRRQDRNGNSNLRCERRVDRDKREMLPAKTVVDLLLGFSVFRVDRVFAAAAAAPPCRRRRLPLTPSVLLLQRGAGDSSAKMQI